jgi:hypothetical protein
MSPVGSRGLVTDVMVDRAFRSIICRPDRNISTDDLRNALEAALRDPRRCALCGASLAGMQASAVYCCAAHRVAAKRALQAAQGRNGMVSRRRSGRQLAFGRAVAEWTAYLEIAHELPADEARMIAVRVCSRALPRRQREGTER